MKSGASMKCAALAAALLLSACATPVQPLYQWGGFPAYTHDTLRGTGKGPQEQLEAMGAHALKVSQAGQKLPPGFQAHMGLLQLKLGRPEAAEQHFAAEQAAFPESAAYLESLRKAVAKTKS